MKTLKEFREECEELLEYSSKKMTKEESGKCPQCGCDPENPKEECDCEHTNGD